MPLSGLVHKDLQGKSCLQTPLLATSNSHPPENLYHFMFQSQEAALPQPFSPPQHGAGDSTTISF